MKHFSRILCLLLLVCVLPLGLFACGEDPEDSSTVPSGDFTNWEDLDFSGTTLRIGYNTVVNSTILASGAGNSLKYLRGPDDAESTDMTRGDYQAAYERHERVCAALDLTVGENFFYDMITWDGDCDSTLEVIRGYNTTPTATTPTIVIHQNYGMVRAGIEGLLYNALEPSTAAMPNYLDLDDEHWYRTMMEENTIDTSKIYMLMGDYFIDQFRMAFGVLFNTGIADTVLAGDGGFEYLYDLVENGAWTYDEMMSIASRAYTGEHGEELVMGVLGDYSWFARSFFATSGLDVFKRDASGEAFYIQGEELDPIVAFVDKLETMQVNEYASFEWSYDKTRNTNGENIATTFINDGALFATSQMVLSFEGQQIRGMTNAASILPTPKYVDDLEPKYGALVSDNAGSGGIVLCAKPAQFTAATAFLQMMTEESDEFFEQYYEKGLKLKNNTANNPGHNKMLDIIHDGICSPMSFLYDNYCAKSLGDTNTYQTYGGMMNNQIFGTKGENAGQRVSFNTAWAEQIKAKPNQWSKIKASFGTSTTK